MKAEGQDWLLSLSAMSLLGPKLDIDGLASKGFYKKPRGGQELFAKDLIAGNQVDEELLQCFLEGLGVADREQFYDVLDRSISRSEFAKNIERLMQLGRTMNAVDREKRQTFIINGHPYLYEIFEEVMSYEFHWPKEGFLAYDLANAVMLVRVGIGLGYMDEELQSGYLERLAPLAQKVFEDYRSFGRDAAVGRQIHSNYLLQTGAGKMTSVQTDVLGMAYYSLWQYMVQ